jgi:hypothetical protein
MSPFCSHPPRLGRRGLDAVEEIRDAVRDVVADQPHALDAADAAR